MVGRPCDTACGRAATRAVGASVGRVLDAVHSQAKASAKVVVTDYWNVFEDGDVARQIHGDAFLDWSDAVTAAVNSQIRSQGMAHDDQFVDVYPAFKGDGGDRDPTGLLASDGDHPNAAGEAAITKPPYSPRPPERLELPATAWRPGSGSQVLPQERHRPRQDP